jgi:hypothetical protein
MSLLTKGLIALFFLLIISNGVTGSENEYASEEQQMLDLINEERALYDLEPLSFNAILNDVASEHSKEMIEKDYFSHDSYDGTSFSVRMENAGYDILYAGENIAMRYPPDLIAAHEGLMNSPGHRANILNPNYNEIGIGIWVGEYSGYSNVAMYTQDFGWSDPATPSLQVTSKSPTSSITESDGSTQVFSINTNIECDISWSFDDETIKVDNNVVSSYCEIVPPASGTYQVKATASDQGEDLVTQWTWTVTEETVQMKGDSNNDGKVNLIDFRAFAQVYKSATIESSKWADFNDDGLINIVDFRAFTQVYNK